MAGTIFNLFTTRTLSDDNDLVLLWDDTGNAVVTESQTNFRDALITGGATTIATVNLTASRALIANGSGKVAVSSVTDTELAYLSGVAQLLTIEPVVNLLGNGNMLHFDLTASPTVADNDYFAPLWRYLTNATSNRAAAQQSTSPPGGSRYFVNLTGDIVGTAFVGIFQTLRANDSIPLQGKSVSLSFYAKSNTLDFVRAGVMSWTGTADAITADPVSSWDDTPTLITNWSFDNAPGNVGVSGSWQRFTLDNISIDASATNIGVLIWGRHAFAGSGSADFDLGQVQLQAGAGAGLFVNRSEREERDIIARNDYTFTAAPGVNDDITAGYALGSRIIDITNDDAYVCLDPTAGAAVWKKTTP